jgi:hypothetical protein
MRFAPQTALPPAPGVVGPFAAGRSALQRRIVAPSIVETEAGRFGEFVVESLEGRPVGEGR